METEDKAFILVEAIQALERAAAEIQRLRAGIIEFCSQKADDRCVLDHKKLGALVGIEVDCRVGDKAAMLENCKRYIDQECESGGWPTYAQLDKVRMKAERVYQLRTEMYFGDQAALYHSIIVLGMALKIAAGQLTPVPEQHASKDE